MDEKNIIKVYTTSNGAELNVSAPSTKQTISATNNRAQYFAEQAMKYRDEAKYYSEQVSNVNFEYINNIFADLETKISMKQDAGDYALKDEIPTTVGELENNLNFTRKDYVDTQIEENKLPNQEGNIGKFLMADGDKGSWVNLSVFHLFDTKISDYILQGESAKGWALQGTYVNGAVYPDFYAKVLEEKESATATEVTLGNSTITMYIASNGHQYYDIVDKNIVDAFFYATGTAWFYGVDTEQERVFLPRNNYFEQLTTDTTEVGQSVEAGLPNLYGNLVQRGAEISSASDGVFSRGTSSGNYYGAGNSPAYGAIFNASAYNPIYGNSNTVQPPAVKKLLYICVGNTIVNEDRIDVGNVLSEIQYKLDRDLSNCTRPYVIETYQNGTSWYRVYSDGWCEQGGIFTVTISNNVQVITFIKPYRDINYTVLFTRFNTTTGTGSAAYIGDLTVCDYSMTSFTLSRGYNGPVRWRACGYIV